MTDISAMLIEELSGPKRSLELHGAGLPFKGVPWTSKLSVTTTWYPGNPDEATQHVMGAQDPPVTWEGRWSRTMLSRSPCVYTDENGQEVKLVHPHSLLDVMDSIQRGGARLRVTWMTAAGDQGVTKVREGRCTKFDPKVDTIHDIKWNMEWEWMSRGGHQQKVVDTRDGSAAASHVELESELASFQGEVGSQKFISSNRAIRNSVSALTLGQLEAFAGAPAALVKGIERSIQQQVSNLKKVADIASKLENEPFEIANGAAALAQNCVDLANQTLDQLSATPPELMTTKQRTRDLVRSVGFFGKTVQSQQRLAAAAQRAGENISTRAAAKSQAGAPQASRATQRAGILAIYVTRDGDTALALSSRYYGSPDFSAQILKANHLPWNQVQFDRGHTLIIPVLSNKKGY